VRKLCTLHSPVPLRVLAEQGGTYQGETMVGVSIPVHAWTI
jgi:hypothetical protein